MFKNESIKKIIVLGVFAISAGHGMEPQRVCFHSSILAALANRPVSNRVDLNDIKKVLNFNENINMEFSGDFSMDVDNVIPQDRPTPVRRNLRLELDAIYGGPENQAAQGNPPLPWGINNVVGDANFDYASFISYLEAGIVDEDYAVDFYSAHESDDEWSVEEDPYEESDHSSPGV